MHIDFYILLHLSKTVAIAQLVRASDCGSEGRGFEPHQSPETGNLLAGFTAGFFFFIPGFTGYQEYWRIRVFLCILSGC